jgi:SAM-dependent methyltransferase
MNSNAACPICHGETIHEMPVSNWGEMRRCVSCELIFANPMTLPETPESFYDKAYKGVFENPGMKAYSERLTRRLETKSDNIDPEKLLFWGAHDEAKTWLKKNVQKGSVVLDIGCGLGNWLDTLRKNGFVSVGLDVAKEVVDIRTSEGFEVWHGTINSIEPNWKQPAVCTCFFVLHHLPDPVGFLATIRSKFPKATLVIGMWNVFPVPQLQPAGQPPRTLTWWGPKSLKKALEKAGYRVNLLSEPIAASEFAMPKIIRQLIPHNQRTAFHYRLLSIYYTIKPVVFWPLKFWKRLKTETPPSTMLAIGEPC